MQFQERFIEETEAVARRYSEKKVFLKMSQNLQENAFIKKILWHQQSPANFAKFLRTPIFYRTPPVAASEKIQIQAIVNHGND